MNPHTTSRLEAAGWTVGDVKGFLNLSDEEASTIDRRLAGCGRTPSPGEGPAGVNGWGEASEGTPGKASGNENDPLV